MNVGRRSVVALMMGFVLMTSSPVEALQCVPFAREVSGISIRGDAWTWWNAAVGQYDRGHIPRVGAVVVFKKFAAMRYGHVAVVARVVNSREVMVDHANWAPHRGRGRGQVSKMVAVTDVSPRNDWTEVRVWNASTADFGTRTYPTYGFIYPASSRSYIRQASVSLMPDDSNAVGAVRRRPSPAGDPVLATADRQIAAALADGCCVMTAAATAADDKAARRPVEAKPAEVKPIDAQSLDGKTAGGVPLAEAKPVEAKMTVVAVNAVKTAAVTTTGSHAAAATSDGVWEGDTAAAKQVGSGRY